MSDEELNVQDEEHGDHSVPADLIELYEVLEWEEAQKHPRMAAAALPLTAAPVVGTIITREQWGARRPRSISTSIRPEGSTAHYEGTHMGWPPGWSHESCYTKVRAIQAYHMDHQGWNDIAYTSITCPHGVIFVGRWWHSRTAANGTNDANFRSYAHCVMIGEGDDFSGEAKLGLAIVFRMARQDGGAGASEWVHQDWFNTSCPGPLVREYVRSGAVHAPFPPAPHPTPAPPPTPFPAFLNNFDYEEEAPMVELIKMAFAEKKVPLTAEALAYWLDYAVRAIKEGTKPEELHRKVQGAIKVAK